MVDRLYEAAAGGPGRARDQAGGGQRSQCLPDRAAADAEASCQLGLGWQPVTDLELAGEDRLADLEFDLFARAADALGLEVGVCGIYGHRACASQDFTAG